MIKNIKQQNLFKYMKLQVHTEKKYFDIYEITLQDNELSYFLFIYYIWYRLKENDKNKLKLNFKIMMYYN